MRCAFPPHGKPAQAQSCKERLQHERESALKTARSFELRARLHCLFSGPTSLCTVCAIEHTVDLQSVEEY